MNIFMDLPLKCPKCLFSLNSFRDASGEGRIDPDPDEEFIPGIWEGPKYAVQIYQNAPESAPSLGKECLNWTCKRCNYVLSTKCK